MVSETLLLSRLGRGFGVSMTLTQMLITQADTDCLGRKQWDWLERLSNPINTRPLAPHLDDFPLVKLLKPHLLRTPSVCIRRSQIDNGLWFSMNKHYSKQANKWGGVR